MKRNPHTRQIDVIILTKKGEIPTNFTTPPKKFKMVDAFDSQWERSQLNLAHARVVT